MHASDLSRRSVLAGTAATAALVGLPSLQGRAQAAGASSSGSPPDTPV
ncbi:twin-arginine translocation signal domain-containing protein [Streptomyces sp. NBC_01538]